ncbi:MAG TPA: isochorismate synthase [Melioribacteraceae bacterium]|nr:isochorismate synthase [Melioribacteraceae bacterium]
MLKKIQKISDFVNNLNSIKDNPGYLNPGKFICPIDRDLFEKSFDLLYSKEFFFYWNDPSRKERFWGIDQLYSLQTEEELNSLNFISNPENSPAERIPDILISAKFPGEEKTNEWNEFDSSIRFIPKFLFFNSDDNYYFVAFYIRGISLPIDQYMYEVGSLLDSLTTKNKIRGDVFNLTLIKDTSKENWERIIYAALDKIRNGSIQKVVLARRIEFRIEGLPDFRMIISELLENYSTGYIFIFRSKSSFFFGATPEKLFEIDGNILRTEALAGTIERGSDEEKDRLNESILSHDQKELAEHQSVIDFIAGGLEGIASELIISSTGIKKLKYIQHLWTRITAKLNSGITFAPVLKSLHPTPAVCGVPKEEVITAIQKLEDFDRGLFAGALGWYNKNSAGTVAVAIRSALITNNKLILYAGCGIVEGSNAEKEFYETELKLKSILSLFRNETKN